MNYPPSHREPEASAPQAFQPLHQARQLLAAKRYQEAHGVCARAIAGQPDHADAYFIMGVIHYEHGDFRKALDLFKAALGKGHPEPGPHIQAARCLENLHQAKQALSYIESAKQLNPADSFSLASIGATLSRLDRHEDAVEFHRKATQAAPSDPLNHFNLAAALQFLGDFEGSRNAYRTTLKIAPNFLPAYAHLVQITKQTAQANDLPTLQKIWNALQPQDLLGRHEIGHAIAKVHEDLGDVESAMLWLGRAKEVARRQFPSPPEKIAKLFEHARTLSGSCKPVLHPSPDGPVFVVGLPRTGTTLVDRIISSHSTMVSGGERHEFAGILRLCAGGDSRNLFDPGPVVASQIQDISSVGESYLDNMRAILGKSGRFTDKMPFNFLLAPSILAAIPSARIVCLRRHPADSVLSIYRQKFSVNAEHLHCSLGLESLAHYVAQFHELVDVFTSTLPDTRFQVIDYEALVDDAERHIRALLDFCGLEFETACLNFQDNSAPVATASVAQVRQPMYSTSKGRWKKYQQHLQPALDVLNARNLL